jgi:hypothetical protein
MATAGMALGIWCTFGMLVGMVPFLGWVNWFNLPLSFVALCLSIAGLMSADAGAGARSRGIVGLILAIASIGFGGIRWMMGGGIL